jgi:hypothetical protein
MNRPTSAPIMWTCCGACGGGWLGSGCSAAVQVITSISCVSATMCGATMPEHARSNAVTVSFIRTQCAPAAAPAATQYSQHAAVHTAVVHSAQATGKSLHARLLPATPMSVRRPPPKHCFLARTAVLSCRLYLPGVCLPLICRTRQLSSIPAVSSCVDRRHAVHVHGLCIHIDCVAPGGRAAASPACCPSVVESSESQNCTGYWDCPLVHVASVRALCEAATAVDRTCWWKCMRVWPQPPHAPHVVVVTDQR